MGIILGADMTAEAAFTKLIYVLGLPEMTFDQRKKVSITVMKTITVKTSRCYISFVSNFARI
nr:unnamed protein product [Callosobruchus analis]